jgi:DNA modification methylase
MKSYFILDRKRRLDRPPEFQVDYHYPKELVELFLKEYTKEGDRVFDPFAGFGTTLYAAEELYRVPLGIECLLERVDFIRQRLSDKDSILLGDSRQLSTFHLPPIDFVMTSPPWMLEGDPQDPLTGYTENGEGYYAYLRDVQGIFEQVKPLMTAGGRVVVHAANLKRGNELTLLAWDMARSLSEVMNFEREIIVCYTGDEPGDLGYEHEYCLVFQTG